MKVWSSQHLLGCSQQDLGFNTPISSQISFTGYAGPNRRLTSLLHYHGWPIPLKPASFSTIYKKASYKVASALPCIQVPSNLNLKNRFSLTQRDEISKNHQNMLLHRWTEGMVCQRFFSGLIHDVRWDLNADSCAVGGHHQQWYTSSSGYQDCLNS